MTKDEVTLVVEEALQNQDVGKDIARVSWEVMEKLSLSRGDIIEVEGTERTYASVYPSSSPYADTIYIDGNIRRRSGAGIREQVTIRKARVYEGKSIEFQIIQNVEGLDREQLEQVLSSDLKNEVLYLGKAYKIPVGYQNNPFDDFGMAKGMFGGSYAYAVIVVSKTDPSGAVFASEKTKIKVIDPHIKGSSYRSSKASETEKTQKSFVPDVHYEDIGGLNRELSLVREMIELPLRNPELFERLGIEPPKGVLLYGPPGTGKTLIAKAVANEVNAHFITLSGPEIMNKYYGESEGKLREVFEEAEENAPSIIFIDEIDSIAPKREETKGEVERRIVAQLLSLMDGLKTRGKVVVIAATNLPDNIDPALRRGGRFDREIEIGIPDVSGRLNIFNIHARNVPLDMSGITIADDTLTKDEKVNLSKLSDDLKETQDRISKETDDEKKKEFKRRFSDLALQKEEVENNIRRRMFLQPYANQTHGFVGADISLVVKEAAMHALRKILEKVPPKDVKEGNIDKKLIQSIKVTSDDFQAALSHVEPSAMREVLIEIPNVTWNDVGGLEEIKKDLKEAVEWPIKYPNVFKKLGTKTPKGILMFGPPGTGKTLMAKAVAHESECNFISIKGPELMSKWVGESERGIREIFRKARQAAPSIIFFDEIDALVPKRGGFTDSTHVTEGVVSQILTELDGLEELKNVTIIGATNRPDMLDDALLRPGRLERHIYVPAPDEEGRRKIFEVYLKDADTLLTKDITIEDLVKQTKGFVGADIEALVREAKLAAMREFIALMNGRSDREMDEALANVRITKAHFAEAALKVRPSLDVESRKLYEWMSWDFLYNERQKEILYSGRDLLIKAGEKVKDDKYQELSAAIYEKPVKDFGEIERLTQELDK